MANGPTLCLPKENAIPLLHFGFCLQAALSQSVATYSFVNGVEMVWTGLTG